MPRLEKSPEPMKSGLIHLRDLTQERIRSHGSAFILFFGDHGVGKSSLARIVDQTKLGISLDTQPLVYADDQHQESGRLIYHIERGGLPSGLPLLTAVTRITPGLAVKNYGEGKEVLFVEVSCDRQTQIDNLVARSASISKAAGISYSPESIRAYLGTFSPELTTVEERTSSGVYADILLDMSSGNRITIEEAISLFGAQPS